MTPRRFVSLRFLLALLALGGVGPAIAQVAPGYDDADETRRAMAEAQAEGASARVRAEVLEAGAARATEAATRTAQEAAAVAARIQQAEAGRAANEARIRMIDRQRANLRARLAQRQRPVMQLTAALQRLSRRPAVLSLLRPGSVRDTMYMRALLETMLPDVERRTAALRAEIARGRSLQQEARRASAALRASEQELGMRRQALAALETRQRLASREASGVADREAERALALAEQARDLGGLVRQLDAAGLVRDSLARLPGPLVRPARPEDSQVTAVTAQPELASGLGRYQLPLAGRLVAGFGDLQPGLPRSRGISIAARAGAQAVAPAAGRVAFAGPYRGYGNIVIIEHPGGWTTLVTGLGQLDAQIGQRLVAGSPLGVAGPGKPLVGLELRRNGEPVNPLDLIRAT
jgi:septal ring factor EnvC (AmiA/AmiB activator)